MDPGTIKINDKKGALTVSDLSRLGQYKGLPYKHKL